MNFRSDAEIMQASLEGPYVGGGYYNPIARFMEVARQLKSKALADRLTNSLRASLKPSGEPTFSISPMYLELRKLLGQDEFLFGVYEKPQYRFAVFIHREERLMDFESQVASGALTRCGFFGLERSQANEGLMRVFLPPHPRF
jgi:hypothetical protein